MTPEHPSSAARPGRWRRLLAPSWADLFFVTLLAALFGRPHALETLLWDGDTGWHIQTGEYILRHGNIPFRDLFSFSRPGEPWFAWEWLSDVLFACVYRLHGLEAVAALGAVTICLTATLLFLWLARRGAGMWISSAAAFAAVSASSVHFLARPHLFSLLLFTVGLWLLDEDRRRHTPVVWLGIPLAALWANLHAGFVVWIGMLGLLAVAAAFEPGRPGLWRYVTLCMASAAASLLNPYGWRLHEHVVRYLGASWILDHVTEFQSPQIRSENTIVFAVLLLAGAALAMLPIGRRRYFESALVWCLGFAAMRSARHIPLYAVAAVSLIAMEAAGIWRRAAAARPASSAVRILWELGAEFRVASRLGPWGVLAGALLLVFLAPAAQVTDFPASRFPVAALANNRALLAPAGGPPRILTSDQWADYLLFRLYPAQRVFFDGRSDFYGQRICTDYQELLAATPRWRETMARYGFQMALLPREWPLAALLDREPGWERVYQDREAILFRRTSPALKDAAVTADLRSGG